MVAGVSSVAAPLPSHLPCSLPPLPRWSHGHSGRETRRSSHLWLSPRTSRKHNLSLTCLLIKLQGLSHYQEMDDVGSGMPSLGHTSTPLKVLTVPFAQFGHAYHSQRKQNTSTGLQGEPPNYFQQLRKGRRTN